jgi:hypothetical protein
MEVIPHPGYPYIVALVSFGNALQFFSYVIGYQLAQLECLLIHHVEAYPIHPSCLGVLSDGLGELYNKRFSPDIWPFLSHQYPPYISIQSFISGGGGTGGGGGLGTGGSGMSRGQGQ